METPETMVEAGTATVVTEARTTPPRLDDHLSNVYLSALGGDWWDGAMEVE